MTLYEKALRTDLHSRFIAREEDLGRPLTDDEVRENAQYLIDTVPYGGTYEGKELTRVMRQMRNLLK